MSEEHKSIIGAWKALNSSVLSINQQRCAKVRNRNVECLKCAAACTSGCISVVDGELTIDATKCVGCGTCATVCPTCALEPLNPNDAELASECLHAVQGHSVYITCSRVDAACGQLLDAAKAAHVVCLGRVEEALTCGLAASGVSDIVLVCGDCGQCAQKYGRSTAEMVIESSNGLLEAWKSPARVRLVHEVPAEVLAEGATQQQAAEAYAAYFSQECACEPAPLAEVPEVPEITGFTPALKRGKDLDKRLRANGLAHVMKDGTLPHFIPNRRERLLDSLASMGEPENKPITSRLWGVVVIDGMKCSSCRMCATFCPTGAIRKWGDEKGEDYQFGITHHPADCVKCLSCHDICAEGAITVRDETMPAYLMEGAVHKYPMKKRPAEVGTAQQILNAMKLKIPGNVYER